MHCDIQKRYVNWNLDFEFIIVSLIFIVSDIGDTAAPLVAVSRAASTPAAVSAVAVMPCARLVGGIRCTNSCHAGSAYCSLAHRGL